MAKKSACSPHIAKGDVIVHNDVDFGRIQKM